MVGVWTGVGMLLYLLGFGLALLLCRHAEREETQQPVVIVRERMVVTVLGVIVWVLGFVLTIMGVIVAGTPPFAPDVTAFVAIPGVLLFLLGIWMLWLDATGLCLCSRITLFCILAVGAGNENLHRDRWLRYG